MASPIVSIVERVVSSATDPSHGDEIGIPTGVEVSTVRFANGQAAYVSPDQEGATAWKLVLEHLQALKRPAYVELKPNSRAIDQLRIPLVARVLGTRQVARDRYEVRFDRSAVIYIAETQSEKGRKDFELLRSSIKAPISDELTITSNDDNDVIVDVQAAESVVPAQMPCPLSIVERAVIGHASVVEQAVVQGVFADVVGLTCSLPDVSGDCLPLQFPDDFCWVVANRVCQELTKKSIESGKVWLFGNLRFKTANKFTCIQRWQLHVAAFVRKADTKSTDDLLVVDPVVFPDDGPRLLHDWQDAVQGHVTERVITDRHVYRLLGRNNGFCELPHDMESELTTMRDKLRLRARGRTSPPPYGHCLHT